MSKIITLCAIFITFSYNFYFVISNQICENNCADSPYFLQDLESCDCFCYNNVICPQNQNWNEEKCDCICKEIPRNCRHPFVWSKSHCKCLCPESKHCKGNQIAVKPNCKCECPNSHEMEECFKEDVFNSWNKTSCECFYNPVASVFGNLFDKGFRFTDLAKAMFNSENYDDDE